MNVMYRNKFYEYIFIHNAVGWMLVCWRASKEDMNVAFAAPFVGSIRNAANEGHPQHIFIQKERARTELDGYHYELTTTTAQAGAASTLSHTGTRCVSFIGCQWTLEKRNHRFILTQKGERWKSLCSHFTNRVDILRWNLEPKIGTLSVIVINWNDDETYTNAIVLSDAMPRHAFCYSPSSPHPLEKMRKNG